MEVVCRHTSPFWQPQLCNICKLHVPNSGSFGRHLWTIRGQQKLGRQVISLAQGVNGRIRFILVTAVCVSSSMLTVSMSIFVSFGMHCLTGVTFPKITRFLVSSQDNPAWHVRSSFSGLLQASSLPRSFPCTSVTRKLREIHKSSFMIQFSST